MFHRMMLVIELSITTTLATSLWAQTTEYFIHSEFLSATSDLTVINFDNLLTGNGILTGNEFTSEGLTIIQRDGFPINVLTEAQNDFVTPENINSAPNVISSTEGVDFVSNVLTDNFDFVLSQASNAAGLWIGNIGDTNATTVEFINVEENIVASEVFGPVADHVGIIVGPDGVFDNRIFYGVTSSSPIGCIRVHQPGQGEGIVLDDVQFTKQTSSRAGDFDFDGDVDGRDFLAWQRNPSLGDLADWQAYYGAKSAQTASFSTVPEPNASVLFGLAVMAIAIGSTSRTKHRRVRILACRGGVR